VTNLEKNPKGNKILPVALLVCFLGIFVAVVFLMKNQSALASRPYFVHKDPPHPRAMAKIGDEIIDEEVLIGEDKFDFFELEKKKYDLQIERINKLMIEKLIGSEAKKAGMPLEEYMNKKIIPANIVISDATIAKFIEEKHIPAEQATPQIKERIRGYLQNMKKQELVQQHLAIITKPNPVEIYIKKPKLQISISVDQAPLLGKKDAPVSIIAFSDFECPFCSRGADILNQVKKKYGNKVSVAFKHFPLAMHQHARQASEASMCVNEQGSDKFWKFHDLLFKNQDKLDAKNLEIFAKKCGVDEKKYKACVETKKYASLVQKDLESGEKIGIKSTPTFFINGQMLSGAVPLEQFSEIIDEELQSLG